MTKITLLLSSVLALIFVWLAFQVIKQRKKHKVSIGDGGVNALSMAIRAHGNFAEYVPVLLILLGCAELNGAHPLLMILFAVLILLGRMFHAYAFLGGKEHFKPRVMGMKLTLYTLIGLSVYNIGLFFWNSR